MSESPQTADIAATPAFGNLRRFGQGLVAAAVLAGIIAAWRWRAQFDPLALTALLRGSPAAPLIFLGLHIVASLTFVPRSLLGLAAGIVFGIWWGLLWAALGSVVGAVAGFLLARYVHSAVFDRRRWTRFASVLERAERGGWRMVTLIRLVPVIPHSLSNYALGLTRLRLGDFALGSLLGQLPLTVATVDLGAAGERAMRGAHDWVLPTAIGLGALALTVLIPAIARRRQAPAA
ncbi:MAG TPA: TVP38/TMEM64 family protein [Stellaceae bacterium]|nr:TVP38/TMEM64 family protein [Stellaceae bacterium]